MSATILYIEDNAQNLRLVRKMLAADGYTVLEALNGYSGLAMAREHKPDLILVDINLPDIDGIQVTTLLKNDPDYTHIPIVALTANALFGDRERFLSAGCDGYLAKPISRRELLEIVSKHVALAKS